MNAFFASLLLTVALLQVTAAQTTNALIAEYKPLISERQRTLGINIGLSGSQIGQTHAALGAYIDITSSNFTDDLVQLDDSVNLAVVEAQAASRSIDACVAAVGVSVSALNPREIQACRSIPQLALAKLKLSELGLIQKNLGNVLSTCLTATPLDVAQIRSCLDEQLASIDASITSTLSELESILTEALTVGNECVDLIKSQWENQVSVIQNDFNTCIAAS